jgi:two-component system, chemotaxis family, chemotaxis protein CheY
MLEGIGNPSPAAVNSRDFNPPESSYSWRATHACNVRFRLILHEFPQVTHTVLVCDDAPYMRTLLGRILERGGFQVVGEAETGLQAVEQYKALRPDVVTMDIVMRDLGGIDAVRQIRAFDEKAKILMCSALAQPALVAEAMEAGAMDFVMKPFQASHLLEAVQHVLA